MESQKNPWKKISQSIVYDNEWIRVEDHIVINPSGKEGIYGKVHFKNIALGIVPLDREDNTWLVGQYRYPLNQFSWEIPEGGGPEGTNLLESARRELKEETGLVAKEWQIILKMHLSNSVSDELAIVYLAEGLSELQSNPEETEHGLVAKKLPFKEALEMVISGKITDSMSVAGILSVARLRGW